MDHDMPDVEPALADIAPVSGVNDFPRDDNDTPEELRARAELAAALEALLDADAASGQDNDLEELLQPTQRAQRLDMAAPHHQQIPGPDTDSNAALSAGPGAIQDVVQSEPVDEPPPASPYPSFPAVLHEEPLIPNPIDYHMQSLEAEEPSTPSQNRIKWIPSSPIKKLASQQYLSKARDYLRRLAQAQGIAKPIPDPGIILRFGRKKRKHNMPIVKKILEPAEDNKEILVELMKGVY